MMYKNEKNYDIEKFIEQFKKKYDIEYIKKQLRNVYFIIGTAYAGKSTMIKMLSNNYNGVMCRENYAMDVFKDYDVNPIDHPNLCYTDTHSMEEFVNRTPDEYFNWLRNSEMEITPIEISELLKLVSQRLNRKIFVDTSIPLEILRIISDYDHIAVMLADPSLSVNRFFEREDYEEQMIYQVIQNCENPEETMLNFRKCMEKNNSIERYNYFLTSGFYVFKRDDSLSLRKTMTTLAKHFKL